MANFPLVDNSDDLHARIDSAFSSDWISIDTEFLREKTYFPLLCLIQCRTDTDEFCIDALAVDDLAPLSRLFSNPNSIKIIHSCRQDLEAFDRRLREPLVNIFDTQIAAAFCGYGEQVSYAALVEDICRVSLDKSHTRTDWSKRPLSDGQLQYAMDDVRYLRPLQQALAARLAGSDRVEWFNAECADVLDKKDYAVTPDEGWRRLKGGAKIPVKLQPRAKALAVWRENKAQKKNLPREWILSSRALIDICFKQPKDIGDLSKIEKLNRGFIRKSGNEILRLLENISPDNADEPVWSGILLDDDQRKRVKDMMKKLAEAAKENNLSQSLLANRRDVEALVAGETELSLLQGWRYDLIGRKLLTSLDECL